MPSPTMSIRSELGSLAEQWVRAQAAFVRECCGGRSRGYHLELDQYGWSMPVAVESVVRGIGEPRECYANAGRMALWQWDSRYLYCEGYAVPEGLHFPLEHAWLIDWRTGEVHDPTWPDGVAYFGVVFQPEYHRRFILALSKWGVLPNLALEDEDSKLADLVDWRRDLAQMFVAPDQLYAVGATLQSERN